MTELLILLIAGLGTWLVRASFALLPGRGMPELAMRGLQHARHAVFAALIAIALSGDEGAAAFVTPSPYLLAAAVAGLVAWRTGGMLRTVAAGCATVGALTVLWP